MANKGKTEVGLFGTLHHYDEHGNKTGKSEPGLFGGYTNYDSHGNKTGHSSPGMFGGYTHYDNNGRKIGDSTPGMFGSYHHTDNNGNRSTSDPGMFGTSYNHSEGCYVATCVYGSYDCPEVWTLRRYRDNHLAKTIPGRAFIRTYYAISPTVVKWFGKTKWFKKLWRQILDKKVSVLNDKGFESTPYNDKKY